MQTRRMNNKRCDVLQNHDVLYTTLCTTTKQTISAFLSWREHAAHGSATYARVLHRSSTAKSPSANVRFAVARVAVV